MRIDKVGKENPDKYFYAPCFMLLCKKSTNDV